MQDDRGVVRESGQKKRRGMRLTRILASVSAAVVIFGVGFGVGSGAIVVGPDGAFQSANQDLPKRLDYREIDELYDVLRRNFDGELTVDELMEGLKRGLAGAAGDSYTEYLNDEEAQAFDDDLNGTFSGIGAELSKEDQLIVIVSPIAGFPAAKAGLMPRDAIVEIDGESAINMGLTEAVSKIRGPVGTEVKLKVVRDNKELDFSITRAQITIPSVESEVLDGNIGYLKVSRFAEDTVKLARQAAQDFKQKNVKGVILDVRYNPGGLLDASVDVAGIWLPRGTTVLEEKRGGVTVKTLTSPGPATLEGIPTVVLINEGSASASEIIAGALKDNGAATLLGTKTFGKGSVQQLEPLRDGGILKVTIARWFTPGGKNLDSEGITPDRELEATAEELQDNKDPQRDAAIKLLQN